MSSTSRDEEASTLIERCGYAAAALTLIPIPLAGEVGVAAVHAGMVVGLARLHGVTLTSEHAAPWSCGSAPRSARAGSGRASPSAWRRSSSPSSPGSSARRSSSARPSAWAPSWGPRSRAARRRSSRTTRVRAIYRSALAGAKARFDPRKVAEPAARAAAEAAAAQASAAAAGPARSAVPSPSPPAASPFDSAVTRAPGPSPFDSAVSPPPARPPIDDALAAVKTDRLTRLRRLRDDGVLLDSEYDAACRQLAEET